MSVSVSEEDLRDLIGFLSAQREDLRSQAFDAVLAFSQQSVLLDFLKKEENEKTAIKSLLRAVDDENVEIAKTSLKTMINLAESHQLCERMLKSRGVARVMDSLRQQAKRKTANQNFEHLHLMLLTNLTQLDTGKAALLQLTEKDEALKGMFLNLICDLCLRPIEPTSDREMADKYIHAVHLLVNISASKKGRHELSARGGALLSSLLCFLRAPQNNPARVTLPRREACLQLLWNLCADAECHEAMGVVEGEEVSEAAGVVCQIGAALLPPSGDKRRRLRAKTHIREGMVGQGAGCSDENAGSMRVEVIEEDKEDLTSVHPFILREACGPPVSLEARRSLLSSVTQLLKTKSGREAGRKAGLFDVLRIWDLSEETGEIKEGISEIVHLLVFSEEELEEQDKEMRQKQAEQKAKQEKEKASKKAAEENSSAKTTPSIQEAQPHEESLSEVPQQGEKNEKETGAEADCVSETASVTGLFDDIESASGNRNGAFTMSDIKESDKEGEVRTQERGGNGCIDSETKGEKEMMELD
uniref:Protein HGH1 C-terminal domain-containing protein n=1 Tax=Chromera velia CCMP2878 TaxID=1169474 RepID=A0A0G4FBV0_9ALVE|mmetsp:Transcript_53292/g.104248  ORF Transcript_53292/g.104248 Transcript_53292/m.104248 type:complete len:530 (+) Transcript_53292:96-1685(+)|eukprot:Cvel_16087.t1-p1 / transcript=Cvel_16087.t1 / gene=Cvel_16087 / organism=Chromera_velia_CCMP2878 / gene_product=hypothetical protein / transcript_product=hypothetical protein / location=Cvel_scaffold1223:24021-27051(-) / protein_length=529 / sequence_SO=supercontig / SO=protein_coding / is_pseudo=false